MKPRTFSFGVLLVPSFCLLGTIAQDRWIFVSGDLSNLIGMPLTNVALRTESGLVALSDAQGRYQFAVPLGWSGTVTPEKTGWAFTPANRAYTNLTADVVNQGFTANAVVPVVGLLQTNNFWHLSWDAASNASYRVEFSSNLRTWEDVGETVNLAQGPVLIPLEDGQAPRRFARLKLPGVTFAPVAGRVELPPNFPLALSDLRVVSLSGESPLNADGEFTTLQPGSGPAMVMLVNGADQPVLYGHVNTTNGTLVLNAQSTATFLLFQAVGGFATPPSTWAQGLALLSASPEATRLADTIARSLSTNALALAQPDARITDALLAAVPGLLAAPAPREVGTHGRALKGTTFNAGLVKIAGPDLAPSGLECFALETDDGVQVRNSFRRNVLLYLYRTGYVDAEGRTNLWAPGGWIPVKERMWVPAANAFSGVVGTVVAWALETGLALDPQTSAPLRLPIEPAGAQQVFYKLVAVGNSRQEGLDSLPPELKQHPLRPVWTQAGVEAEAVDFIKELLIPGLFASIPAEHLSQKEAFGPGFAWYLAGADFFVNEGVDLYFKLQQDDLAGAFYNCAGTLLTSTETLESFVKFVGQAALANATVQVEATARQVGKNANWYLWGFDMGLFATDVFYQGMHLNEALPVVTWDLTALAPLVQVLPPNPVVLAGTSVGLEAKVKFAQAGSNVRYQFDCQTEGQAGQLQYGPLAGASLQVVQGAMTLPLDYAARASAPHLSTNLVTVRVTRIEVVDGEERRQALPPGINGVVVLNVRAQLKPAETNLLVGEETALKLELDSAQPRGLSNLVYTWTLDGSSGSLSGAADLQRTYTANATGWDVVKAKVKGDFGGKPYDLAEAKADLKVVPVRVSVRPQRQVMGQDRVLTLTAKVEPEPAEGQVVYRWVNVGPAGELVGGYDQETTWPTNQFRSSATVEGTNRITVTAYLVTATETNEIGEAKTDIAVLRWPEWTSELLRSYRTAVGDWNGDGYPDLALEGYHSPQSGAEPIRFRIYILTNNSGHGFTLRNSITAMSETTGLYPIDWDGDGILDFVRVKAGYRHSEVPAVQVFKGDGQGGFNLGASQPLVSTDGQTTWFESEVGPGCAADVDEDGDLDLVASVSRRDGEDVEKPDGGDYKLATLRMGVVLWRNAANGSLPQPEFLGWTFAGTNENIQPVSTTPPLVADLNRDQHPDLVFHFGGASLFYTLPPAAGAYFLLNDGHGHFAGTPTRVPAAAGVFAAEDFDGDATVDLWLGTRWQGGGAVLLNDGAANFTNQMVVTLPSFPELPTTRCWSNVVAVTDINLDGHPDFLCQAYTKRSVFARPFTQLWTFFMVNDGHGYFTPVALSEVTVHTTGRFGPLVDMDRDGDLDLIYFDDFQSGDVSGVGVLLNSGDGTF